MSSVRQEADSCAQDHVPLPHATSPDPVATRTSNSENTGLGQARAVVGHRVLRGRAWRSTTDAGPACRSSTAQVWRWLTAAPRSGSSPGGSARPLSEPARSAGVFVDHTVTGFLSLAWITVPDSRSATRSLLRRDVRDAVLLCEALDAWQPLACCHGFDQVLKALVTACLGGLAGGSSAEGEGEDALLSGQFAFVGEHPSCG
jgi:hypothetical protein